jgi:hypothetical protein
MNVIRRLLFEYYSFVMLSIIVIVSFAEIKYSGHLQQLVLGSQTIF